MSQKRQYAFAREPLSVRDRDSSFDLSLCTTQAVAMPRDSVNFVELLASTMA
jgi:hypothetical protein